ncbi:MAG: DNA-directed RNA polymerase subunit beta', partial [Chloroflexi bacterium]|nr:DNA-directed RNA polymerase subunit beta' [Chloroflexota bacterium]
AAQKGLNERGAIFMMAVSGARGNIQQIRQMAGMRGLMADPSGRIIDLPIRSNFREGLTVLEYFISTHGARKGLADTALRTADSGYLTRRLVDVAQDVIVTIEDCGTEDGMWITESEKEEMPVPFRDRILGRLAADPIKDPNTGKVIVDRNEEIDENKLHQMQASGVKTARVRSPLLCEAQHGVCRYCYGRNLANGRMVEIGEAVGIIAAQSIGEPGTQLTMRTFHTGGVAGEDITSGLPRVEELFEARVPKGLAVLSEIEGVVEIIREEDIRKLKVVYVETFPEDYPVPPGYEIVAKDGTTAQEGDVLARPIVEGDYEDVVARGSGRVAVEGNIVTLIDEQREEREYVVPYTAHLKVESGQHVYAGQQLTDGSVNPQDILQIQGRQAVQRYLVDEVQKVYRSQGVNTNDKHIEIIVRKMLSKVSIDSPGDTHFLPGELIDRYNYEEVNARVLAEGGEPATAQTVLLGVTKASLNTNSFLSAASFQETTRVLTEAAINGSVDYLRGLKENVIIGKLIPAGSGVAKKMKAAATRPAPETPLPYPSEEAVTGVGEGILPDQEPVSWEEEETGREALSAAGHLGDDIAHGNGDEEPVMGVADPFTTEDDSGQQDANAATVTDDEDE